ncbi:hypothetical protein LY76DRAFT_675245 [Colletotrichum caudatum]|nr:hypothetical protein LY76DRAFT_675245 [Colletotrichum caudatum]
MLSCQYSGPGSIQYTRRLASADCVLKIITQETPDGLPPLPLVPYAMSMSTTVIYRALRDGERLSERVYKDLGAYSKILEILSLVWSSARGVVKLVKRLRQYTCPDMVYKRLTDDVDCTCENSGPTSEDHVPSGNRRGVTVLHQEVDCDRLHPPNHSISSLSRGQNGPEGEGPIDLPPLQSQYNATWVGDDLFYTNIDQAF